MCRRRRSRVRASSAFEHAKGVESAARAPPRLSGPQSRTAPVELRERIGALGSAPSAARRSSSTRCCRPVTASSLFARLTSGVEDARDELVDALATRHDVLRELLLDHLYVHAGEDVAATSAGSPPASTRSCGRGGDPRAGRRRAPRPGRRAGSVATMLTLLSAPRSGGAAARARRPRSARTRDGELDGARARRGRPRRSSRQAPPRRRCRPDRPADAEGRGAPRHRRGRVANRTRERADRGRRARLRPRQRCPSSRTRSRGRMSRSPRRLRRAVVRGDTVRAAAMGGRAATRRS